MTQRPPLATVSPRRAATAAAAVASIMAVPVLAAPIQVNFSGSVSVAALGTTSNSGYVEGQAISGQFTIDSVTGIVSGATLGTFTAPADTGDSQVAVFSSTNDAIFSQGAFDSGGASANNSIVVDFSTLTSFTSSSPVNFLLQNLSTLAQQVDLTGASSSFPSTATYLSSDGSANGVTLVRAYLTSAAVYAASVTATATTITQGQTATLTATPAVSGGTYAYQWFSGSSGDTSNPIAGATGASFTTPPLSGTQNYWVQITTSTGGIEDSATITVTVTIAPATDSATDAPLPGWALGLLGAGLVGLASRGRQKRGHHA